MLFGFFFSLILAIVSGSRCEEKMDCGRSLPPSERFLIGDDFTSNNALEIFKPFHQQLAPTLESEGDIFSREML